MKNHLNFLACAHNLQVSVKIIKRNGLKTKCSMASAYHRHPEILTNVAFDYKSNSTLDRMS